MKKLRTLFTAQEIVMNIAFAFWLTETTIFLILEGWHWKATNPIEIVLDKIVGWMLVLWIILFVNTVRELLKLVVTFVKEKED